MQTEIRYNGLSENPSDYTCPDGDIAAMLNLINEENALRPILPPKDMFTMADTLSILLIHKATAQTAKKNYIFKNGLYLHWVEENDIEALVVVSNQDTEGVTELNDSNKIPNFSFEAEETITDTKAIGNTFIVLTNQHTHFFLFKSDAYKYLGAALPYLPLNFGLQTEIASVHDTFNIGTIDNNKFISSSDLVKVRDGLTNYIQILDPIVDLITEKIMAQHNQLLQQQCVEADKFGLPFFVRYAYRLFDGSLAMQSAPVLMIPATIPQCNINTWETDGDVVQSMTTTVQTLAATLDYTVSTLAAVTQCQEWDDIITSIEIFVSAPLYFYKPSEKVNRFVNNSYYWGTYANVPRLTISRREGFSYYKADNNAYVSEYNLLWALPPKTEDEIRKTITTESSFYHVASVSLNELRTNVESIDPNDPDTTRFPVPIPEGTLASLTSREAMEDGYHAFDDFIYNGAFGYNSRMVYYDATRISGVTKIETNTLIPYTNEPYGLDSFSNFKLRYATNDNVFKYGSATFAAIVSAAGLPIPFIFIPETQISKVSAMFVWYNATSVHKTFSPIKHDHLNGVYIYTGFSNIDTYLTDQSSPPAATSDTITFQEPNKLFLSEVNNPFLIKPTNIITINVAKILGISTAAKALSLGQFGQFPLYAFTDEGVWALEISSTGTISARQPITRDVCTSAEGITQIDSAVLFPTARGIMLLSGSDSQCISDILNSKAPFDLGEMPPALSTYLSTNGYPTSAITRDNFLTFLEDGMEDDQDGSRMLYDYTHQRIIVFKPSKTYAYVYSLKSKTWGMMNNRIADIVDSYPDAIAVENISGSTNKKVVNYSKEPDTLTAVTSMLITRPFKLDRPDFLKTIDTIIQRGVFSKGHVQTILYGARDFLKNEDDVSTYTTWRLIASSTDHILRGFSGSPYKYFRMVLLSTLEADENIFGATIQFQPKDTNQPR